MPHKLPVGLSKKTASPYSSHSSYYQPPLLGLWPHHHFFHPKNPTQKISATPKTTDSAGCPLCTNSSSISSVVYPRDTWHHVKRPETNLFLELKQHLRRNIKLETDLKQDFKWSSIGCLWWMKSSWEGYKHWDICHKVQQERLGHTSGRETTNINWRPSHDSEYFAPSLRWFLREATRSDVFMTWPQKHPNMLRQGFKAAANWTNQNDCNMRKRYLKEK